jgi:hypothetical protein
MSRRVKSGKVNLNFVVTGDVKVASFENIFSIFISIPGQIDEVTNRGNGKLISRARQQTEQLKIYKMNVDQIFHLI